MMFTVTIEMSYVVVGLLVLGFVPYWIGKVRAGRGWRREVRAAFWSLNITLRRDLTVRNWSLRIILIEKLRDKIWGAVGKLKAIFWAIIEQLGQAE
jgi:hypothetical protein